MARSQLASLNDVREYWDSHPLLSHELADVGSPAFFEALDRIKRTDAERFSLAYWGFDAFARKRVLDVGCGPGWLTVQYASADAHVDAVDLAPSAVELAQKHLEIRGLHASVQAGNAEALPFQDGTFDLVVSSGALHHTPDPFKAFGECFRVLKPGGKAKITLYRKGILHHRSMFAVTRLVMRAAGVRHPGADLARHARDVDDFIRLYDGAGNPVGVGMTDTEWRTALGRSGFGVESCEVHYFPKRFVPFHDLIPGAIHYLLDRYLATMVYFNLNKP